MASKRGGVPWREVLPLPDGKGGYLAFLALVVGEMASITYYFGGVEAFLVVALVGLLLALLNGSVRPYVAAPLVLLALYVGWSWLSVYWSIAPAMSAVKFSELWKVAVIFLLCLQLLRPLHRAYTFSVLSFGAMLLFPVRGALFNYMRGYSEEGRVIWNYVYDNPNDLAAIMILAAALGIASGFVTSDRRLKRLLFGFSLLPLLVIALSGSRGVVVATGVALLIALIHHAGRPRTWAAAISLVLAFAMFAPKTIKERMVSLTMLGNLNEVRSYDAGSAMERVAIWKNAVVIIKQNPITGVGIGTYPVANAMVDPQTPEIGKAESEIDAHSTYLTALAETGFVGGIIYFAFLAWILWRLRRARLRARRYSRTAAASCEALELGIVAYLIACIWANYTRLAFPYVYLGVALVWAEQIEQRFSASLRARGSMRSRRRRPMAAGRTLPETQTAPSP